MKLHGIVVVMPAAVLLITGIVFAQAPGTPTNFTQTLDRALQLAHTPRYAEAEAAIKGLPPPPNDEQRIAFYRLKAAIASGLGHSGAAAQNMEVASRLAPENMDLRLAAGIARLQAQVDTHINPASTFAGLRSAVLPPEREIEVRLRLAEILSQAGPYAEAATAFAVACRLAPARSDLFFDLALARFRIGQLDAALASAEQAKALDESGSVESLIGDIHEKRGASLPAVHSYQTAATLEPADERP